MKEQETRPTPETDAEARLMVLDCDDSCLEVYIKRDGKSIYDDIVLSNFARKLERERDELREAIRESLSELQKSRFVHPSLSAAITKLKPFFP